MAAETSYTKEEWQQLERAYEEADQECEESFEFKGETMYTAYAKHLLKNKIAKKGENVIVVSNMPPKQEGVNLVTVLNI